MAPTTPSQKMGMNPSKASRNARLVEGKAAAAMLGFVQSKLGGSNGASVGPVVGGDTGSVVAAGPTSFKVVVTDKHYTPVSLSSLSFQTPQQPLS